MYSPAPQTCTTKIFGPAYTVQMVDAADTTSPKPSQHFVDGVHKDAVVFISQPEGFYSACWGGLMSTRAKYLGAKGVVVDGNVRDLGEHREMGFPVRLSLSFSLLPLPSTVRKSILMMCVATGFCKRHLSIRFQHFYQSVKAECSCAIHLGNTEKASDYQSWRLDLGGSGWCCCCAGRACRKVSKDL